MTYQIHNGDCIEVMKTMADNSVDSIVTDPPYELGFMGKSWDSTGIAFNVEVWREALRVLKPGGHLLAFSGSRTYHRMAVAIEDAGFEIRDQIMWIYGSGFPKSLDIAKSIEAKLTTGSANKTAFKNLSGEQIERGNWGLNSSGVAQDYRPSNYDETAGETRLGKLEPTTEEAKQWQGWGTALKPAHEPLVLARKPIQGTVANNVLTHGVGGLNIDGTRIGDEQRTYSGMSANKPDVGTFRDDNWVPKDISVTVTGRWPANVIHDGDPYVVELFGEKPAKFFYCAKASKRDRNEGLDGFEAKFTSAAEFRPNHMEKALQGESGNPYGRFQPVANHHPTVKPTDLMRYLCRLITPPNGIVLDPFMGSGSTGKGAAYEGFDFIGIEQSAEYCDIAKARIEFAINERSQQLI